MVLQTSIKVTKESKEKWTTYKNHPKESMESMINRILKLAYDDEEPLNGKDLKDIQDSLNDFKNNKFKSNKELLAEL